jgi:hypothetical protein
MQVFSIAPADVKVLWVTGILAAVLLIGSTALVMWLIGSSVQGAQRSQFEVSAEGLRLRGDVYGRMIPAASLRPDGARRVDFAADTGLQPHRRTGGTSVPGYQSGWYRLRNGEKALLYLTDRSRAVYVPTSAGYAVLLSPSDPDGFLQSLQAIR